MSKDRPFNCEVPGCNKPTSRIPHVCTPHFIEGWGRLPDMPLPEEKPAPDADPSKGTPEAPLYVSDKDRKRK